MFFNLLLYQDLIVSELAEVDIPAAGRRFDARSSFWCHSRLAALASEATESPEYSSPVPPAVNRYPKIYQSPVVPGAQCLGTLSITIFLE